MNKLFSDLKTDEEKSNFFLSGRGYETGVIAPAIQNDVAMVYHRCAEYIKEVQELRDALERCRFALEPYDDIKPRDWKSDRENLRRAHQTACATLAAMEKQNHD